jgi:superfamily II RNA helicase
MVKICPTSYPSSNIEIYEKYFNIFPLELSPFQKWAIQAIVEGNHILVTAHTGSGKSLPAEFAIDFFVKNGKKVIYTSPIKALSNQKYYEFTKKFPHISFGILTGDIKTNPEADVLIMTTEILMNSLYNKNKKAVTNIATDTTATNNNTNLALFDMDFDNELACVVFDEVHYINDEDRGKVWEETIMMLPKHIQMVMLSATLDSPEKFALWCETRGDTDTNIYNTNNNKIVYLATTYERVVPLTHYSFITCTQGIFKILKDKQLEMEIMKTTNTLNIIQDSKGNFHEPNYQKVKKILGIFEDKHHFVKRQHVLNTVSRHLYENNMLPAICFVLSRKTLEQCAKEVTTNLLEDDSKVPYIVKRECEQIIRKLPNYQEYLNLPEYINLVSLLEKGIAIHHAGIMPVLREMVELLFSKGYIKLLFATETFAVGINMPTKTVLFTDVNKFDGSGLRTLYSHEYNQMSGRAGRRGIDTIGYVIHLTNLFHNTDQVSIKTMMKGKPQTLVSKFKISYNLLLNLINIGETDYTKYTKRSMIQNDIDKETKGYYDQLVKLESELQQLQSSLQYTNSPMNTVQEYIELKQKRLSSVNKKRKEIDRAIEKITSQYKFIEKDIDIVSKYQTKLNDVNKLHEQLTNSENILEMNINSVLRILHDEQFLHKLETEFETSKNYSLTTKGQIATNLREVHCLVFANIIESGSFKKFLPKELVAILSCFTNITVPEEKRSINPISEHLHVQNFIQSLCEMYQTQNDLEINKNINTGFNYSMHFDLIDYLIKWCDCETEFDCKQLINQLSLEKDIFLGEFVKAILKINNITSEMEKIAENIGDMEFLSILKQVPIITLKYVATNQSLYV